MFDIDMVDISDYDSEVDGPYRETPDILFKFTSIKIHTDKATLFVISTREGSRKVWIPKSQYRGVSDDTCLITHFISRRLREAH